MGGHALRGALSAWLGLIALQTIGTQGGSGRIASFFADADSLVQRALDPTVPAIRDRRTTSSTWNSPSAALGGATPAQVANGAQVAGVLLTPGAQAGLGQVNNDIQSINVGQLSNDLGGLSSYTPEQLQQAYGLG